MSIHVPAAGRVLASVALALVIASCGAPPLAVVGAPPPPAAAVSAPPPQAVAVDPAPVPPAPAPPDAPAPPTVAVGPCALGRPPPLRAGGDLTVESPARATERSAGLRLRTQVDGALTLGSKRTWIGPEVPSFVFLVAGTRELFLLDQAPDGFVGLYRDPYGASSCTLSGTRNCSFGVAFFDCAGRQRWLVLLDPLFSRPDHLEVQDVRYADGVLYFNEACQTYSREAGGRCSSLVAVEPLTRAVLWRTPPLVSNNVFLVHKRYLITGYGFTAEPDALFIVRRSDGKIMQRVSIPSAHQGLSLDASGTLTADIYSAGPTRFRTEGFDGEHPSLTQLRR